MSDCTPTMNENTAPVALAPFGFARPAGGQGNPAALLPHRWTADYPSLGRQIRREHKQETTFPGVAPLAPRDNEAARRRSRGYAVRQSRWWMTIPREQQPVFRREEVRET